MEAYIRRGLSTEGNLRFKTDWASLIVGSKFTVFAMFYFVFEGNFPSTSPCGAYIWRGHLTEGFLRSRFEGLIHGRAYFRNFTVCRVRDCVSVFVVHSMLIIPSLVSSTFRVMKKSAMKGTRELLHLPQDKDA